MKPFEGKNPFEKKAGTPGSTGGKKSGGRGRRLVRNLLITLVFALVYFYVTLPAINLHAEEFYVFAFLCAAVYSGLTVVSAGFSREAKPKEIWAEIKGSGKVALGICGGLLVICLVGAVAGSVIFRSGAYTKLLNVQPGDFTQEVQEISYDRIPMLDKDSASRLGDRKLGELSDMVSQFEVTNNYTQINYKDAPVRVATLEYGDVFKWLSNKGDGLPAYIIINMVTQNAEVVRLSEGMKYSPADHFGRNLYRHLRFAYPTYLFGDLHFEIDDQGNPWWICPRLVKTIGLFGGTDVAGAVLVNAVTGENQYFDVKDIPTWVDQVYDAEILIQQYDYYGQYQGGFINSLIGQKNVTVTTQGYNYIAMEDDVYVYTGVTSVGGDQSNIGFILCNQRTKETHYYACAGAEEYSARDSAEGVVQHLNYTSTFPLLLNINGQPTYFMSLKDNAQLVKMYAMVNVQQYNIVATGNTVAECESNYIKQLSQYHVSGGTVENEITGTVEEVRTAVIDGNSFYYFKLAEEDCYYSISAAACEEAIVVTAGDSVKILASTTEGAIRPAVSIEIR